MITYNQESIDLLLAEVAKRTNCNVEDIEWYSWPQTFATTSGPRGGVGGCAMTVFQVYAFNTYPDRFMYCGGVWKRWSGEPFCRF